MAYNVRGYAYQWKGDYDRAIADQEQAIKLDPSDYYYFARGNAYLAKGDYDRAISDFNKAIKLDPTNNQFFLGRGDGYRSKGDYDHAISDYEKVMNLDPIGSYPYLHRGDAYLAMADYDRAIADYDKAIKISPDYAGAYNNRGLAYYKKAQFERALQDFDRASEFDPRLAKSFGAERIAARGHLNATDQGEQQVATAPPAPAAQPSVPTTTAATPAPETQASVPPSPATGTKTTSATLPLGRRVALVIGNSAYRTVNPLKNPEADSKMVAEEFRKLGFAEVIEKRDLSLADLSSELKAFGDKAADADWAVVYYAGHGIEVGGVNYVIPIDAELKTSSHVEEEAIPLDRVLSKVEGAHKLRLVILDACRDNPFSQRLASAGGGTRSVGRGLARVEPRGGVLVAYSARDGNLAQDGDETNSPFAQALVQHLEEPGVEISLLFRKVADSVWTKTHGEQEPFTYGSLPAEALYFRAAAQ
ncbi:caspase family protein [Methyloceanibacter sp.]|uniref:caspase family protein n=1 Tax=Methyloceanibacter sp. TaxID=1965321 RepID=UPI003D6D0208